MEEERRDTIQVQHNAAASRFEAHVAGLLSVADYRLGPGTMTFTHTGVPDSLSGQGIATQLVEAGLKMARERGLRVIPQCSFVAAYMRRHPAEQDLLHQP